MIMGLYVFISVGIGILIGYLISMSSTLKKSVKYEESGNNNASKYTKVKVKITYNSIKEMYYVYYNGECQKAFRTIEEAVFWSENNIDKYLKGIEVKYEKEY